MTIERKSADAAYIAALDPTTVLALLDVAAAAREWLDITDGGTGGDRAGDWFASRDRVRAALARLEGTER